MLASAEKHLMYLGAPPQWEDIMCTPMNEADDAELQEDCYQNSIMVVDVIADDLHTDVESVQWAMTCIHRTMEAGNLVLPAPCHYTSEMILKLRSISLQIVQDYLLLAGEELQTDEDDELADALKIGSWLQDVYLGLGAWGTIPCSIYHGRQMY